jgi:hypothetical protein
LDKEQRKQFISIQLRDLQTHLQSGHLTVHDRLAAAQATSALLCSLRLENGEPVDLSVVREAASLEDQLAWLESADSEAEEA